MIYNAAGLHGSLFDKNQNGLPLTVRDEKPGEGRDALNNLKGAAQMLAGLSVSVDPNQNLNLRVRHEPIGGVPDAAEPKRARPPSLEMKAPLNGPDPGEVDEGPAPAAGCGFDPDLFNDNVDPFANGGSVLQDSRPPAEVAKVTAGDAQPIGMEFGLEDDSETGEVKTASPKKQGKKPAGRHTPKKAKLKPSEVDVAVTQSSEIPAPKSSYGFDTSQMDDPNFNPFGGKANLGSSSVLPKGSYSFDPDALEDSVDPFAPSNTLAGEDSLKTDPETLGEKPLCQKLETEGQVKQSPQRNKGRMIT